MSTLSATVIGGGGGGGSTSGDVHSIGGLTCVGGGGGGSSPVVSKTFSVSPGDAVSIVVGSGGSGAPSYGYVFPYGDGGQTSSVSSNGTVLYATGGLGGQSGGFGSHTIDDGEGGSYNVWNMGVGGGGGSSSEGVYGSTGDSSYSLYYAYEDYYYDGVLIPIIIKGYTTYTLYGYTDYGEPGVSGGGGGGNAWFSSSGPSMPGYYGGGGGGGKTSSFCRAMGPFLDGNQYVEGGAPGGNGYVQLDYTVVAVDCSYTTTGWSACSASCGGGSQNYYYTVTSPAQNGGSCPVSDGQVAGTQSCNTQACVTPVSGGWSVWSSFGSCSASCGGGSQTQTRTCTNPAPTNGGADCSGSSSQSQSCNTQACVCSAPLTDTQTLNCQTGYSGSISQSRSKAAYPGCAWENWTTTANNCVPQPPSTPTLSALYQNGAYIGTSAPAYEAGGYQLSASATSPSGANLNYYFEWSPSETAQWSGWVGSGGWGTVTHYTDAPAGSYYARAYAYDSYGNWSLLPSDWKLITLTTAAPTVSCVGTPGNPYVGQPVSWTSSVSGGSHSYTYSWSGTDGLSGTSSSVSKTYPAIGQKSATLNVADTRTGLTGSATCATGTNQPNGPTNGGSCSTGVCPGTCTGSLSASPDPIDQGDSTNLTWSVTGNALCATSCTGSGFNTGGATSGTAPASVLPVPPTSNYALTCSGGTYGPPPPVNTSVTVYAPTATLTANGQTGTARVNPHTPNNTTIVWSSSHVVSCSVTKNGNAWQTGTTGSMADSVTSQTVYKADCVNKNGIHATASVTVNVLARFNEF